MMCAASHVFLPESPAGFRARRKIAASPTGLKHCAALAAATARRGGGPAKGSPRRGGPDPESAAAFGGSAGGRADADLERADGAGASARQAAAGGTATEISGGLRAWLAGGGGVQRLGLAFGSPGPMDWLGCTPTSGAIGEFEP